jgi:hypothetical protein
VDAEGGERERPAASGHARAHAHAEGRVGFGIQGVQVHAGGVHAMQGYAGGHGKGMQVNGGRVYGFWGAGKRACMGRRARVHAFIRAWTWAEA